MKNRVYTAKQANKNGKVVKEGITLQGQARPDTLTAVVKQELLELVTRGSVTSGTPFRVFVTEEDGKKVGAWTYKAKPFGRSSAKIPPVTKKKSTAVPKPTPKKAKRA